MKTAEIKTSSAARNQIQAKRQPFFSKEGQDSFFSNSKESSVSFFSTTGIQPKLTIGQPNDKYEVEADAMADKVVQKLSTDHDGVQSFAYQGNTALQTKCDSCEKEEEEVQKKEESSLELLEKGPEIQEKPIFESNAEEAVQTKAESDTATESSTDTSTTVEVSPTPLPAVQTKSEDHEKEEQDDQTAEPELQKKEAISTASDPPEEEDPNIQLRSLEMERTEYPIQFKRGPNLQLSSRGGSGSGTREQIVEEAQKMIGKIKARKNDGTGKRVGAEHLLEIFHLAANDAWADEVIENVKYVDQFPHWCGIFSVYAIKKAGIDLGFWEVGKGVSSYGTLEPTQDPQPGDIGYFTEYQHHCIIKAVNGDTIDSIDGNSGVESEVLERTRPRSQFHAFFTPFTGSETLIQNKEETSSATSTPDNLQDQLNVSAGKGSSMDETTRGQMESGFGADFSDVNIHTDSSAVQMSQGLNAQAFTHGKDIYFNEGRYNPETAKGKHLLAHELTHTIQQGASSKVANRKVNDQQEEKPNVQTGLLSEAKALGGVLVESAGSGSLRPLVERYAPGLYDLINGGLVTTFREKIFKGITKAIKKIKKAITNGTITKKIRELFAGSAERLKSWQKSTTDACASFYEKIQAIVSFLGELMDPVIQGIREELSDLAEIASGLWADFGKPAWKAIKKFAGKAWKWIKKKADWIWDQTKPIREHLSRAWRWIKRKIGIVSDSASSVWKAIKKLAAEIWDEIKGYIRPIIKPLKVIGGVLLLLSPLGPIILIYKGAPHVWDAIKWVYNNWAGWETLVQLKEYFANEILPVIKSGIQLLKGFFNSASKWLKGIVEDIKKGVKDLMKSLGIFEAIEAVKAIIGKVRSIFNSIKSEFNKFLDAIKEGLNPVLTAAKNLFTEIYNCVKPVFTFIIGLVYIASNPYMWPVYAVGLMARFVWALLTRELKLAAIDYIISLARSAVDYFKPAAMPDILWTIHQAGANAFFNKLESYSPDQKIQAVEKILNLLIDPQTYGGLVLGIVSGFVKQAIDLIVGIVSLTISMPSIIEGIINFIRRLIPDMEFLERIKERMDQIIEQIRKLINIETLIQDIRSFIEKAPEAFGEWLEDSIETGRGQMAEWGEKFAEKLMTSIMSMNNFNIGYFIGDILGRLIFEILLTKGIGLVISKLAQGVNWLRRGLTAIRNGARGMIGTIFTKAKEIFAKIMQNLRELFKRFGEKFAKLFDKLKKLLDDFIAWIIRAFKGGVKDRAQWILFTKRVGLMMDSNTSQEGYSKKRAKNLFRPTFSSFRTVARIATIPIRDGKDTYEGLWELRAVKRFGLDRVRSHIVGSLLQPKRIRYTDNPVVEIKQKINVGSGHMFKIEGSLTEPQINVYSNRKGLNQLLRDRREQLYDSSNDEPDIPQKKRALDQLMDQKKDLGKNIGKYKSAIDKLYDRPRARLITEVYEEIVELVNAMTRNLQIMGLDMNETNLPPTHVDFNPNGNKAGTMTAQPLTRVPGNTRGQTPIRSQTPPGWNLIDSDLRNTGAWVRAHLLSHRLHGPGKRDNLFPGTRQMNLNYMESQVEGPLKRLVWDEGKVMYYHVSLGYGNTGTFVDIPTDVHLEYADYDPESRQKSNYKRFDFTQNPPTATAATSLNSGSRGTLNEIAKTNGYDNMGNFFKHVIRERNLNGDYNHIDNVKSRLMSYYKNESVLDGHIYNLRLMMLSGDITMN